MVILRSHFGQNQKIKQNNMKELIKIDGSFGEGGGQILRTSLALSIITQTPIVIENIRAGRKKSGLMRQHLVCVQAAKAISHATVAGDELGSQTLHFTPQTIQSGDYHFDIGSAGSTTLVLQTILPSLLLASAQSTVTIKGGTHNPLAPTADFSQYAFVPTLEQMGIALDVTLNQAGFAPVGGGSITANISPIDKTAHFKPFDLTERGDLVGIDLVASELNLHIDITKREIDSAVVYLTENPLIKLEQINAKSLTLKGIGEGNTCFAVVKSQTPNFIHQEVFSLLGEKNRSAESIGKRLAGLVNRYLSQSACVDEYLSDQLLLPMALLAGQGVERQFTSRFISEHTRTQAVMIEKFLPVKIAFENLLKNQNGEVLVTVQSH